MARDGSKKEKKLVNKTDQKFAKQQLGIKLNEAKMLGLPWKKDKNLLAVEILSEIKKQSLLNQQFYRNSHQYGTSLT